MGLLADAPPIEKSGFLVESQADLQDLHLHELNLRTKRKKRLPARVKEPLLRPIYPNVTWSMDFMHDTLENGKKVRSLNVMDDFNREVLQLSIDTSLPSAKVIARLEELTEWRGKPEKIRVDNG